MRIFITGGTGFFGKWLLESFAWINGRLNLDAQAVVLSRNEQRLQSEAPHLLNMPEISFLRGDIQDFAFPEGSFSHIIHAATTAAEATFNNEPPLAKIDTIAGGTRHVLDFAAECGARKFLLTSSGGAYGPAPEHALEFNEDYQGAPNITNPVSAALGESKRMAELLTRIYANNHGFEAKICRCFTFVGPYLQLDIHYAVGNFIRDAVWGRPIAVRGDGAPLRSFMYATDLMVWLWTLLFKGVPNRLYNVGSEHAVSIADLAHLIASIAGTEVVIENQLRRLDTSGPDRYIPSTHRIRNELGLSETIGLETAIKRSIDFFRSHYSDPV